MIRRFGNSHTSGEMLMAERTMLSVSALYNSSVGGVVPSLASQSYRPDEKGATPLVPEVTPLALFLSLCLQSHRPLNVVLLALVPLVHSAIIIIVIMSAAGGTYRGTPNRGQGRGQVPVFENSPSNIPRPKLESHASSTMQSDSTGTSTLSASRQKQAKRDEVR